MIAARGATFAEIDVLASDAEKLHAVITADCSGAHEFDDAISVAPLPMDEETYRVNVFAVDTSKLYFDEQIIRRAMTYTASRYGSEQDYRPMLDRDLTQRLHFAQNRVKSALNISFIVGVNTPPSDVRLGFGRVEVARNLTYKTFGEKCRYSPGFENYGRAAAILIKHLNFNPTTSEETGAEFEKTYGNLIHVPKSEAWKRGNSINQTFMIAANYLVGRTLKETDELAIYRAHDTTSDDMLEVFSPAVARYTTVPAPHDGLGLDVYARVTSPLRRLEDFVNLGLIRQRVRHGAVSPRDTKLTIGSVQRLNQAVAAEQFSGQLMLGRYDQRPSPQPRMNRAVLLSEIA